MTRRIKFLSVMSYVLGRDARRKPSFCRRKRSAEHSNSRKPYRRRREQNVKPKGGSGREKGWHGRKRKGQKKRRGNSDNMQRKSQRLDSDVTQPARDFMPHLHFPKKALVLNYENLNLQGLLRTFLRSQRGDKGPILSS
jgi:hypothetical protein